MRSTLLALALTLAAPALAAKPAPWDGAPFAAPAAEVARAAQALPPPAGEEGSDVDFLLEESTFSFDAAGRQTMTFRQVVKLLSPGAVESWRVEVPWSPWYQQRPEVRVRVVTPDGAEHALDPKTLVEGGADDEDDQEQTFSDARALRGPLPALKVGAVVEQVVVVREGDSLFQLGESRRYVMGNRVPTRRVRLVLEAPRALPLRHEARNLALAPRREERGERVRLTWDAADLPALPEAEPFLPPDADVAPQVSFSTGQDWGVLARRYHALVDAQLKDAALEAPAREAAGDAKGREAVAARLMAWVHARVRYTGLHFGEAAVVPRPPAQVLASQYGDCKDLATLMVGLLRARGIPASVALLRVGDAEVAEALPGFGRFDHAIVHVPGSPELWIDATDPYTPVTGRSVGIQGRRALVAAPATRALARIPEAPPADNLVRATRTVRLAESGPSKVEELIETWGAPASDFRSYFARARKDAARTNYERYVKESLDAKSLGALEWKELEALERPFRLTIEALESDVGRTDDAGQAGVGVPVFVALERLPDFLREALEPDAEARKGELLLPEAGTYELRYRMEAPQGFTAAELPEPRTETMGPATLGWRFERKAGAVEALVRFEPGKRRWSAAEVQAFREAATRLGKEDMPRVRFEEEGAARVEAGKAREGLEALLAAEARHPKEALHPMQRARVLLKLGMGLDAREAARRAVALEPRNAAAHDLLGWVLQHDGVGRRFGPGFDPAGALAAYRKARELDPQRVTTRGDIAILLEHDASGERYAEGAKLDEAIREYQALRKDLKNNAFDVNLLMALSWTPRTRELLAHAEEMKASDLRDALRVMAVALAESPRAAVRRAESWHPSPEARRKVLTAAAQAAFVRRHYPQAHALLSAAAQGASDARVAGQLALWARTKRVTAAELSPEDPRGVASRLLWAMLGGPDGEAILRATLTPEAFGAGEGRTPAFLAGVRAGITQALKPSGLPPRVVLELMLATLEVRTEGDAAGGLRVRLQLPWKGLDAPLYLRHEPGGYRAVEFGDELGGLGAEALRRAEAGDVAGARRWLDWARESLPEVVAEDRPGHGFARGWKRGQEVGREEARLAAARVAAWGEEAAARALPVLLAARTRARDDAERRALDRDLGGAYRGARRFAEALEVADRLLAATPDDAAAFFEAQRALSGLKRHAEAAKRARERLARRPDDAMAQALLAGALLSSGDFRGHAAHVRALEARGRAEAGDYNNAAWGALFVGPVTDAVLADAQRAATMTQYGNYAYLNTLAAVYAEADRGPEAYQAFLKSLEPVGERKELTSSDWYVVGRIAESYGLTRTARDAYAKVKPGKDGEEAGPTSAVRLVQRRLAALDAAGRPRTASPAVP